MLLVRKYFHRALSGVAKHHDSRFSTAVYAWGVGTSGQIGLKSFTLTTGMLGDTFVQEEPRRLLKSKKYTKLAVGNEFTLAICCDGLLYGWGKYNSGEAVKEPTQIPMPNPVSYISAGSNHAAVIDIDGQVFTWGHGGTWMKGGGQLGHNSRQSESTPRLVDDFKAYGAKAVSVACGSHHTLILTDDGELLSCGIGEYGRLGTGSSSDSMVPTSLDFFADDFIVKSAAGGSHSLALSRSGKVYSWGRNDMGQLGHADSFMDIYSMEDLPREISDLSHLPNNDRVVHIAASKGRSLAVTEMGSLYIWGAKLPHVPTLVEAEMFGNMKVINAACGGESGEAAIGVITDDGSLWTFGDSSSKLLGRSGLSGKQVTPAKVTALDGKRVCEITMGLAQHALAIVEIGSI